jgi:hypothetical protein
MAAWLNIWLLHYNERWSRKNVIVALKNMQTAKALVNAQKEMAS